MKALSTVTLAGDAEPENIIKFFNAVESTALRTVQWSTPLDIKKEADYGNQLSIAIQRLDVNVIERAAQINDPINTQISNLRGYSSGTVSSIPQTSSTAVTQGNTSNTVTASDSLSKSGSDVLKIIEAFDTESQKSIASGFYEIIQNSHNRAVIRQLVEENPDKFNHAVPLVVESLKAKNVIDRNSQQRNFCDPVVITEMCEKYTKLELNDRFNENQKYKLKVHYIGDKGNKEYNVFGNQISYQVGPTAVSSVEDQIKDVNVEIENGLHKHLTGLSAKQVEEASKAFLALQEQQGVTEEIVFLSKVGTDIRHQRENPKEIIKCVHNKIKNTEISLKTITFDRKYQADHGIRKNSRIALGQRLLTTQSVEDTGQAVILPKEVHKIKEKQNYAEPIGHTYDKGMSVNLKSWKDEIFIALDQCSPQQLGHVDVDVYKASYNEYYKIQEEKLAITFENCSDMEVTLIYHSNSVIFSNEKTLRQHCSKILLNVQRFKQKVFNGTFLKDTLLGAEFQKHQIQTFNNLFLSVKKITFFINTIQELTVSNEAAEHIQRIQDINLEEMKTAFLRLEPQFEGQKLNYVELESNKTLKDFLTIEPEDYGEAAYLYSDKALNLTIAGHELTSSDVDTLFYLDFERALDKQDTVDLNKGEDSPLQLKDESRAQTKKLDIQSTVFGGFNNSQEEDFYNLLIENGLKKSIPNILVVRDNISTVEELK